MSKKKYGYKSELNNLESKILSENEVAPIFNNNESGLEVEDQTNNKKPKTRTREDLRNIVLIFSLYALQGIPFGLLNALPLILSSRGVSYADQGTLSFASWPYAIKILWAPFVDSFYIEKIGRRKSWIIVVQLALAIVSFSSGDYLSKIMSTSWTRTSQDIITLTVIFLVISFLASTHDIIMDGWAIDLLLKENVSWQATCNSIGFVAGGFMGNAVFILLESAEFCNQNIRPLFNLPKQPNGFIDMKIFLYIYGSLLMVIALFILIFKNEKNKRKEVEEENVKQTVRGTYKLIWKLICKPEIKKLVIIFLTIRLGFATEMIIRLRLIEEGVEKEKITLMGIMLSPLMVLLPVLLNKYMHGPKPMNLLLDTYGPKLIIVSFFTFFVVLTPYMKNENDKLPLYYYGIYFLLNIVSTSFTFIFFVSVGSFNSQISDKSIGGTYMTFLSLWLSIGSSVTRTSVLYLTNLFTFKYCFIDSEFDQSFLNATILQNATSIFIPAANKCSSEILKKECVSAGGTCLKYFDGFYLLTFVFISIGFIWLIFCKRLIAQLQSVPKSVWLISKQ